MGIEKKFTKMECIKNYKNKDFTLNYTNFRNKINKYEKLLE